MLSRVVLRAGRVGARSIATAAPRRRYTTWFKWPALGVSGTLLVAFSVNATGVLDEYLPQENEQHPQKSNASKLDDKVNEAESMFFWNSRLSSSVNSISSQLSSWTWPTSLSFPGLQNQISTLLLELSLGPGSLYSEITKAPPNYDLNPELEWDAEVRLGDHLPLPERAFLSERRRVVKQAFARLLNIDESDIDERDLPVVAIAGSGGGFRAMLNTIGSLSGAQSTGLLDATTYVAGISGSCWALGALYSGVAGSNIPSDVAAHLKDRIQVSYLDTQTLDALITAPTNKYLLSGIMQKSVGSTGTVSLVDIYGTLVASRIFVPSDLSQLDPKHLSLHRFRRHVDNGAMPLPIFAAIQSVPPGIDEAVKKVKADKEGSFCSHRKEKLSTKQQDLEAEAKWLWYEFSPYEVGCDEIGAWIPSWALGRQFMYGKSTERRPELSFTILSGIYASAFCATLFHYFKEVQPALTQLPSQLNDWFKNVLTENQGDLLLMHPVLPDQLPNFLRGLDGQLRAGSPPDITDRETLGFLDAGAELNIPYYPLLRRNVDCIIALDASADSQDLWFTRAEELASKRGLSTWPRGAGWPTEIRSTENEQKSSQSTDLLAESANRKLAQTQEAALAQQTERTAEEEARDIPDHPKMQTSPLSSCEIWIGSSTPQDPDNSRLDDLDEDALLLRDGIGVVYMPLLPNESKVPGFDPFIVSTWRRDVSADESQQLLDLAEANFVESREKIIRLLRAIWLRKKRDRESEENKEVLKKWKHEHLEYNNLFHG